MQGGPLPTLPDSMTLTDHRGRRRTVAVSRPSAKVITLPALGEETPGRLLLPHQEYLGYLAHMHASMEPEPVVLGRSHLGRSVGYSFGYFRCFDNVAAALAYAATLVMDHDLPYMKSLCRCKLPRCRQSHLARKKPEGGPPNRSYCDPTHCDEHHNSAERSAERAAARKAKSTRRKHK